MKKFTPDSDPSQYNNIVIYHDPCPDGWMSAVIARKFLGERTVFVGMNYSDPYLKDIDNKLLDKCIYILDFSVPLDYLQKLDTVAKAIIICDHHKTAKEMYTAQAINSLNKTEVVFDMNRSGAQLTWAYFHKDHPETGHELVDYVGDRDLWTWKLPYSREISAWLSIQEREYQHFNYLLNSWCNVLFNQYVAEGRAVLKAIDMEVDKLARRAFAFAGCYLFEDYHGKYLGVNSQSYQSEVGERILQLNPAIDFAAIYFDKSPEVQIWSLRSRAGSDVDVSAIAKKFGGGGHKDAAGFTINSAEAQ